MYDLNSEPLRNRAINDVISTRSSHTTDWLRLVQDPCPTSFPKCRIASLCLTPVLVNGEIVGISNVVFNWDTVLLQSLPSFINGIDAVLSSGLSANKYTMRIVSGSVNNLGPGDLHETTHAVEVYRQAVSATLGTTWTLTLYPTTTLMESYLTSGPRDRAIAVVVVILVCLALFMLHDYLQRSRSVVLTRLVDVTSRILDDVFPKSVKARMMKQALAEPAEAEAEGMTQGAQRALGLIQKGVGIDAAYARAARRRSGHLHVPGMNGAIADVFPAVTVLFADVAGFTEWSSTKPPETVFMFLGALFVEFDELAGRLGIFKVRHARGFARKVQPF
jgi:hypothetical protein